MKKKKRYSVIKNSSCFIIIMTNVGLQSSEVKKEIDKAMEWNKYIVVCLDDNIEESFFISSFPKLEKKQRIKFSDAYELANAVTSLYLIIEQESEPIVTGFPNKYKIMINSYSLMPVDGKVINTGDTLTFINLESSRQNRVLVNEDCIWDEKHLLYEESVSYTFGKPGVYTFYLKGRESNKLIVTVK